jgi:hypothetical protein
MEKYLIPNPAKVHSTLELLEDAPLEQKEPFILGVIGNSSNAFWTKQSILAHVLDPLLQEESKPLDSILLPNEGVTPLLLQSWAESKGIKTITYASDWKLLGRKARALRDSRILKEATVLLFFLGARSDYYENIAIREVKKGRTVYTLDPSSHELVLWEL